MFNVQGMGLGKTIRNIRQAKGWTLEKLEEESGVAAGTIHAIEARDSSRSQYFPQLAKALGLTVEQLQMPDHVATKISGPGFTIITPGNVSLAEAREPRAAYGMEPILAWEHADDLPEGEFVMVPRLDVHLSAGGGREQVEIDLVKENPQAFRSEWIRLMKLKPAKLAAMRAAGESMEPTIHDGDSLLIDTSQTNVVDGKVYALWYDGGERVKRLFRLPGGGLRIESDNPRFRALEVAAGELENVRVIGRVVHRSGVGGL